MTRQTGNGKDRGSLQAHLVAPHQPPPLRSFISCVSILAMMMSPRLAAATVLTLCLGASPVDAFQSVTTPARPITALSAAQSNTNDEAVSTLGGVRGVAAAFTLFAMTTLSGPAGAVSGGGLDYANLDITGQDFSNEAKAYKGKDFSQVIAKGTNFAKSNLQGCRFYKAYLVNADFSGADLRGASLEDTSMDGASLKDAVAAGSYFGQSLLDVKTMENADFSDAQIPLKTLPLVCEREDVKGTNPVTGVDTRESLMCP